MTDSEVALQGPGRRFQVDAGRRSSPTRFLPGSSGGLLPALFLWRRLAVEGPKGFSDVYYLGTLPLPAAGGIGRRARRPRIAASRCWFYFDPPTAGCWPWRCIADEHSDPCEIHFSDYREVDGRDLPGHIEVYGNGNVFEFDCDRVPFYRRGGQVR